MGVELDLGVVLFACVFGFRAASCRFLELAVAFVWRRLGWSVPFSGFCLLDLGICWGVWGVLLVFSVLFYVVSELC